MSESISSVTLALGWATDRLRAASDTARLDAELLLAHVLGWGRARVLAEGRVRLSEAQQAAFRDLIARRLELEPVAYLTGHKEFYGLDLLIDRSVLIPRPETELLVELAIAWARRKTNNEGRIADTPLSSILGPPSLIVADIGAGSGGIAIAVAAHVPQALVYAVDIAPDALRVAGQNIARHGLAERVRLIQGDLLDALPTPADLLLSNPPYTVLSAIDEGVRRHEPHLALDGGPDGLAIYRRLLAAAPSKLRPGGMILLEIGATQAAAVIELARSYVPAARVELHRDLAGLDRVVVIAAQE
jgi:release factor glutamine methyltransferase